MSNPNEKVVDKAKSLVAERKTAYTVVFGSEDPAVKLVLSDLARFCRAGKSTFDPNPQTAAFKEGRKDVWTRIQNYLQMSSDELWQHIRREGN